MDRLAKLIDQFEQSRGYTRQVLSHTDRGRWFEMPAGVGTHIAWQVGHLAFAEVTLLWVRLLGRARTACDALPAEFDTLFGKGSAPAADAGLYPSAETIAATLDRIHTQIAPLLVDLDPALLDEPPAQPHWAMRTREDALWWAIRHESLHAGQIGLCRRLLGDGPYR